MKILIISSRGHWTHGWFSSSSDLEIGIKVLQKTGLEVNAVEVEHLTDLEKILDEVSSDTLLWANAYFVDEEAGKVAWLNEHIERRNLPFVGSDSRTLQNVLKKDLCQGILKAHELPIPFFTVITRQNITEIETLMTQHPNYSYPLVLKPTSESGSIGVCVVEDLEELKEQANQILKDFPYSDLIIEDFLPSDDVTCGYLEVQDDFLLLPTYYIVRSVPAQNHILSRKERLRKWDSDKVQLCISDENILKQLQKNVVPIVTALDIRGVTRVDGRLDEAGILRFFDVNGLPGLCFPRSVLVRQCIHCFPNYSEIAVFEGLIYTILLNAMLQYKMEIPEIVQKHNLFTMDSDFVIKGKVAESISKN
jgi:D-alanine-D-alanine ligase-like ATP-grasp enzyme